MTEEGQGKVLAVLAVDTGGTFTDVLYLDSGRLKTLKIPSTPEDPGVDGAIRCLAGAGQADADVGRLGLSRAVDHTTHDRHRHLLDAVETLFPFRHHAPHVVLNPLGQLLKGAAGRPAAPWTCGDAGGERAEAQCLKQLARRVHLVPPVAAGAWGQRHADGVADPFVEQDANGRCGPHQAFDTHACLGQTEMERLVRLLAQGAVHGDQVARARDLARDDDVTFFEPGLERE